MSDGGVRSPLELLDVMGIVEAESAPGLRHLEVYCPDGLLTLLWHGPREATDVVITLGGAIGGLLGPARALFLRLGENMAEEGIAVMRVHYRRPGIIERCLLDAAAAADLAAREDARRFIFIGHSFGGAVAVQAGIALGEHTAGVVGLATQSAGCENAAALDAVPRLDQEHGQGGRLSSELDTTPLLLMHGGRDQILPVHASEAVQALAGGGDLIVYPDADHGLASAADEIAATLAEWIPARFAEHAAR